MLFETPAGFALFKVLDEGKLDKVEVSDRRFGLLSLVLIGFVKFGLFHTCLLKHQCCVFAFLEGVHDGGLSQKGL